MAKKALITNVPEPAPPVARPSSGLALPAWVVGLALFLWAVAVYVPIYNGEFIWDDDQGVSGSALVNDPGGLPKIWFNPPKPHADYFPLTTTVFWVQRRLWHDWTGGYHIVNVLLHGLSALLLWRLLRELGLPGAWPAALLFALHPVNAESVAWVSELKNMLTMVFALPACQWFVRFDRTGNWHWYRWSLGFFLLALLAKTTVVTVPLLLLLYLWWRQGRLPQRRELLLVAPYLALAVGCGLLTIYFQNTRAIGVEEIPIGGPLSRLAGAGLAFWFYLGKALMPIFLTTIYPKWDYDPAQWWQLGLFAAVFGVLAVCWAKREGWGRHVGFAFGCYVLGLLPALGLMKMSYMRLTLVADHFQHLALPAIVALVVCGGAALQARFGAGWRPWAMSAVACVAGLFSAMTWERARIHRNEDLMWTNALERNWDSWQAHNRLGARLAARGKIDEAVAHFEAGVKAHPRNAEVHNNVGVMLSRKGQFEQAAAAYREALKYRTDIVATHINLAKALISINRPDDAVAALKHGIECNPDNPEILSEAGFILGAMNRCDDALTVLNQALAINPRDVRTLTNLGVVCFRMRRVAEARDKFREALAIQPNYKVAADNLANLMKETGTVSGAIGP